MEYAKTYSGLALIADPIYRYASFTVPRACHPSEATEMDLLDSPWMQRLRRIYQLQSARWVYPAAEHSRFQHSLGTMHLAGEFGRRLYPSLALSCREVPSPHCVEEILRVAGLLHDVGHGPYGHFFDDNYLDEFALSHEDLGDQIIKTELADIICNITRSPTGEFAAGERLDPAMVAFLIKKPAPEEKRQPKWLKLLRHLFSGIFTADNLDYVQRDAFMTGFSLDMVDIDRLFFYSFFTRQGLTLHQAGVSALSRFLHARLNLYAHVYFHRTTRAIDLHLQEIFRDTMKILLPKPPHRNLASYLTLDEWYLFNQVQEWSRGKDPDLQHLGSQWRQIFQRSIKWKMAYSTEITIDQVQRGAKFLRPGDYEKQIRQYLPAKLREVALVVDMATQDPRPLNPMVDADRRVSIYNPVTGRSSLEPLMDIYRFIPARVVHFRVFSSSHEQDEAIAQASERALGGLDNPGKTNL
jgi:HD superfamily phosphohydrolase